MAVGSPRCSGCGNFIPCDCFLEFRDGVIKLPVQVSYPPLTFLPIANSLKHEPLYQEVCNTLKSMNDEKTSDCPDAGPLDSLPLASILVLIRKLAREASETYLEEYIREGEVCVTPGRFRDLMLKLIAASVSCVKVE